MMLLVSITWLHDILRMTNQMTNSLYRECSREIQVWRNCWRTVLISNSQKFPKSLVVVTAIAIFLLSQPRPSWGWCCNLQPSSSNSSTPFLRPGNHEFAFYFYMLAYSGLSFKWNHTICDI